MRCQICCCSAAERTSKATIVTVCFKCTYVLYMIALPTFLLWMVVATKPVDQAVFGVVRDPALLSGDTSLYTGVVKVIPNIPDVHLSMVQDCGAPGQGNWNMTVISRTNLPGARLPIILASDAMLDGKPLPPDSLDLKWYAVAQPHDFGKQPAISGPQYETDWLHEVGCKAQSKQAAKLSGQDQLLVCISSKTGGAASAEDCDLVKASCSGGIGNWFTGTCTGDIVLESRTGSITLQSCNTPLQPAGICKKPSNATSCAECEVWGCKKPGNASACKVDYTLNDCFLENPPSARLNSLPEFKILFHNTREINKTPLGLVGKSVQLFVREEDEGESSWLLLYSSTVGVGMSETMFSTANPKWCFGPRSQSFYMVACLTSSSGINEREWIADIPPVVDGPPFNDRCTALVGLCGSIGTAASHNELPLDYCTAQGEIPSDRLVKLVTGHRNRGYFWFYGFIFFMIIAHMSTLVTFFGGLFRTDYINDSEALAARTMYRCSGWEELKNHKYSMQQLGALVIWGASKSEERLFILRNWVGRVASVPDMGSPLVPAQVFGKACRCVDVFMDEGHRVGACELWRAFVDFLSLKPGRAFLEEWSKRLRDFNFDDARVTARGQKGDPFKGLNWLLDLQDRQPMRPAAHEPMEPEPMDLAAAAPGSDRAQPLILSVSPEAGEKKYGQELGDPSSPCVRALCTLIKTFRDPRFGENLQPTEHHHIQQDSTRDVVIHRLCPISEDCAVDFLYVARAREQELPLAAYRTLALQHMACLNLTRYDDGTWRDELSRHVMNVASKLWIAEGNFRVSVASGESREVANTWKHLVRVKDVMLGSQIIATDDDNLPDNPDAEVILEWFEHLGGQWCRGQGRVQRSRLQQGNEFRPLVPGIEELSAWEVGRLCHGKIVQLDDATVTLDGLSPLLEYLSLDKKFRGLACGPEEQMRMMQLRRALATPFCGSRGKGGAQNFALQLLRNRGLLHPPSPQQPSESRATSLPRAAPPAALELDSYQTPMDSYRAPGEAEGGKRVLFAIFDARHQPTPDYFKEVLPEFFRRDTRTNEYKLDRRIAFAQVPQTFSQLDVIEDSLDTNNGMMFNMLNLVRNNCGAVTSCGTNSTWQVDPPETQSDEVFDARTKIEDTATSHKVFLDGRRSVYVNSPCVIGIAKRNAKYLGAVARWSEGAVQLFWVTILGDKAFSIISAIASKFVYTVLILGLLVFFTFRPVNSYFLCTDPTVGYCGWISDYADDSTGATIHVIEGAMIWTVVVIGIILVFEFMRMLCGTAPLVRRIVMLDNLTYFWSTGAAFFWVLLNFYMIVSGSLPFKYDTTIWMWWLLIIKVLQYILTYIMKSRGECSEVALYRAQQMFFVTAPMHQLSIITGTGAAFSIIWRGIDKSFWDTDNSDRILCFVKAWTTFIVGSAAAAVSFVALAWLINPWNLTPSIIAATVIFVFMALNVVEAFMDVWDITSRLQRAAEKEWAEQGQACCRCLRRCWSAFCHAILKMRSWTWLVRWGMDLGMPIAVLLIAEQDSLSIATAFSSLLRVGM